MAAPRPLVAPSLATGGQTLATERAMRLASIAIARSIPVGETWKPQK